MILPTFRKDWPIAWLDEWAERAAIMEFSGNLTRAEAEREAERDIRTRALKTK